MRKSVIKLNNLSRVSLIVYIVLDAQLLGVEIYFTRASITGSVSPFAFWVFLEANVSLCLFQIYLSLMATLLIWKLGLAPTFKWSLIMTVWLLAATFIVTEWLGVITYTAGSQSRNLLGFIAKTGH